MSRSTITGLTLTLLFAAACADRAQPTEALVPLSGRGLAAARPGTSTEVRLNVTITDFTSGLESDGLGTYYDGIDKVTAYLSQYGALQFDTDIGLTNQAKRHVHWHFSGYDPVPGWLETRNNKIITASPINIQDLGINGNPLSECISLGAGFFGSTTVTKGGKTTTTTTNWNPSFRYGAEANLTGTAYVTVATNAAGGPWVMTPGCGTGTGDVASLRNDGALKGYFSMPFQITLTKKTP